MDNTLDETEHGMEHGMEHRMEHRMGHRMTDKAIEFRFAEPQDVPLILRFIKELADYKGMLDQVVATEELLNQWLFEKEKAEVILGMKDGEEVGFALFFHLHILGQVRHLSGGLVCASGVPGPGLRNRLFEPAGSHCSGAGLRTSGVVVSGLE